MLRRPFLVCLISTIAGCKPATDGAAPIGSPLPGLSAAELARFREGEALFNHIFTPEQGVGPLFNSDQCSGCHTDPVAGGTGEQFLVRATHFSPPDHCDVLSADGGENIRSQATPKLSAHGIDRQPFPEAATERARFSVPFLFGLGLVEAIPDEDILRNADPDDRDGDGVSGRPGRDASGQPGRFGRKAEIATLPDFIGTAAHLEMGLTTPSRPDEGDIAGTPFPEGVDPAPDPELDEYTLGRLYDFIRFLAPPDRASTHIQRASIERGAALFHSSGCTACHVPFMTAGLSDVAALSGKRIHLYSDLLLHDLGPEFSNVCGTAAAPTELRTAPLMGLRHRSAYLHDRRARDLLSAILLHGGEATGARERFRRLDRVEQEHVLSFLRTL